MPTPAASERSLSLGRDWRRIGRAAFVVWCALTVVALTHTLLLAWLDRPALDRVLLRGPFSDYHVTILSVGVSWLLAGLALTAFAFLRLDTAGTLVLVEASVVTLLYVNVLRERAAYGDFHDYLAAAASLLADNTLPARYLYPPLWAILLEPVVAIGWRAAFDAMWSLNIVSLFIANLLLIRVLVRYGFSQPLAVLAVGGFMVINVPVLRTLGYMQVNLHVLNLILASVLFYPASRGGSAVALSLAAHLKLAPVLLVLPFLFARDWRWLGSFAGAVLAVTAGTVLLEGVGPYHQLWVNLQNVYGANPVSFRDTSIDSLIRATTLVTGSGDRWEAIIIGLAKLAVACVCMTLAARYVARGHYASRSARGAVVLNALPSMLVLMMLMSPLMWEHHGVFAGLPFLLLLKGVQTPAEWTVFGVAYFLTFLVPTFDYYPWSFGRLAGLCIWVGSSWRLAERVWPSAGFVAVDRNWRDI